MPSVGRSWFVFAFVKECVSLTPVVRERRSVCAPGAHPAAYRPVADRGRLLGAGLRPARHHRRRRRLLRPGQLHNQNAIPGILPVFSLHAVVGSLLTAPVLRRIGRRRGILIGLLAPSC
ncbi:hypothetical protein [Micromonospora aurantiaca (nom. illeg.)]|uniref:hypothetical protein n=1 Tax=Micromonospora aurantiaca (nom. illeg.) TaxID=47850 RepID=UPI0037B4FD0F